MQASPYIGDWAGHEYATLAMESFVRSEKEAAQSIPNSVGYSCCGWLCVYACFHEDCDISVSALCWGNAQMYACSLLSVAHNIRMSCMPGLERVMDEADNIVQAFPSV